VLLAESDNEHDASAISVNLNGATVGYLSRSDAVNYRPGLLALQKQYGTLIGLRGVVAGGGLREDGYGFLGVFLRHDPRHFGLSERPVAIPGTRMDTGLSHAVASDDADDTYDLGWVSALPNDPARAIPILRKRLSESSSPIERHYLYHHLEAALYRSRDAFASALTEFDECCALHDGEMEDIRAAFLAKWDAVPRLQVYQRMCIRQAKLRDFERALWWAERGLSVYGDSAARADWTTELKSRAADYRARLGRNTEFQRKSRAPTEAMETIACAGCGLHFQRQRKRGRKPSRCADCRDSLSL
jgi:hypothetical protein